MKKRRELFPASDALHGGQYLDRTLLQFEKRISRDPDWGTKHEGTIEEIPPLDDPFIGEQKDIMGRGAYVVPTEVSAPIALAPQSKIAKAAERWFRSLPERSKQEFQRKYRLPEGAVARYRREKARRVSGERVSTAVGGFYRRAGFNDYPKRNLGDGGYLILRTPTE